MKERLTKAIQNIPGWNTKRKIVVFESDDWGSIRMPSKDTYRKLSELGLALDSEDGKRYSMFDSLESAEDLESLLNTLDSFRNTYEVSPAFTALTIVANPDFDKIKSNNFSKYFYEPFTETCKRYQASEDVYDLYLAGIQRKLFIPQFHGREHLNIVAWMDALQSMERETHLAYDEGMWSFVPRATAKGSVDLEAAFQLTELSDLSTLKEIIIDGLNLFRDLFGYSAEYFVPPNGHINNALNHVCFDNGIKYRSVSRIQYESMGDGLFRRRLHWLGERDKSGVRYITRNCFFEPSLRTKDWVDHCLKEIETAFQWRKPAVISTHRVNYIGAHYPENREHGIQELKRLLASILKSWPDVEFLSSNQLGHLMSDPVSDKV